MQAEIWTVYVPGQEIDKTPTGEYLTVARKVIDYVAEKEGIA
jgi:hypothetical protein